MADNTHLINIILNARDNTSAAVASATAKLQGLKTITDENAKSAKEFGKAWSDSSGDMTASEVEIERLTKTMIGSKTASREMVVEISNLQKASAELARTINDENASQSDRILALAKVAKAEKELGENLAKNTQLGQKRRDAIIAEAKAYGELGQAQQNQARTEKQLAQEREQQERKAQQMADEIERTEQARHRSRLERLAQQNQAEKDAAQVQQRLAQQEQRAADEEERKRQDNHQARMDQMAKEDRAAEELNRKERERRKDEAQGLDEELARIKRNTQAREDLARANERRAQQEKRDRDQRERDEASAARSREQRQKQELDRGQAYLRQIEQIARLEAQRKQAAAAGDTVAVVRLEVEAEKAKAQARKEATEIQTILSKDVKIGIDAEDDGALAHAIAVRTGLEAVASKGIKFKMEADVDNLNVSMAKARSNMDDTGRSMNFFTGLLSTMSKSFHESSGSVASFDNYLRGLTSLGIAAFLNQIILLAGAAAGGLLALASSAATAGAALGGALAAGAAQAIGPLGLLVTAITRVSAVMDVVKQANLLQQQQSYQGADSARRIATATDQVSGANDRLTQANKRVGEAQKGVNQARQEAINKLKELILQERGASLSLEDSQKAIAKAVRSGDTAALPGAFLRRDEAKANLTEVRGDISARQTGVAPEVQQAQQQLESAKQSAKEAGRSLEGAKRSAQDASTDVTAAAGKLNYLMGQLSDAERGLYSAILRLQDVWREFAQTVSEPLIVGFTGAINKVIGLLQDQAIVKAATDLSTEMAKQFTRVFDAFTSPDFIDQFLRITKQAGENLKPLGDIAINLGKAFLDLAEAAGPALSEIVEWVRDISDDIAKFFESGRKSGDLQKFFEFGVDNLKEWGDLLWQVIRLFAAIAGPGGGAQSGLDIITGLADAIGGLADKINDPKSDASKWLRRFFDLSEKMLAALTPILSALADEFRKTFTKEGLKSVEGFVFFISEILIPAIGDFIRAIGRATTIIGDFFAAHEDLTKVTSAFIAFAASMSIILRIGSFFMPFIKVIGYLAEAAFNLVRSFAAIRGSAGLLRAAFMGTGIGAVIAIFVLLLEKAGKLDDIWRQLKESAGDIFKEVKPAVEDLIESVKDLVDAFGKGDGLFAILKPVGAFIGDVLIEVIKTLGEFIGRLVRGIVKVVAGMVDLVTGLLTLDFDKVLEGFKKIGEGLFDAFTASFRAVGRLLLRLIKKAYTTVKDWVQDADWGEIGQDILDAIIDGLEALGRLMVKGFRLAVGALEDFVFNLGPRLGKIGLSIVEAIAKGISDAPDVIVDAIAKKIPGGRDTLARAAGGIPTVGPLLQWGIQMTKNKGGPIPGVGDTDTVPALLTPGEHVLTKGEVAAAGGHGVIFMLRALLGGGGQGTGGRYKAGGVAGGGSGSSTVAVDFEANLEDFGDQWQDTWQMLSGVARRQAKQIGESMSDMYRFFRRTLADMQESADVRTKDIAKTFRKNFGNVSEAVYDSLRYVGKQTNNALEAFDANPVKFSISKPPGSGNRAATGYIGQPGERGRDAVPIWVGRGEAVLNWAQQKAVNARLAVTGSSLNDVFGSTRAYHAGGPGDAVGYAGGGYTGPGHSGAGFTPVWNMARSKFSMSNFTGFDGHSMMTDSGKVSDHYMHRAIDMSNGVLTPQEDALNAFIKTKLSATVKQLIWRNKDQLQGFEVGGHEDHVHFAMKDQYAFNGPLMAKIISRALRGMSISALLKGATGGTDDSFDVDHVDPIKIRSTSKVLGKFIEKVANKVRRAANKLIDKRAARLGGGHDPGAMHGNVNLVGGGRAEQVYNFFKSAGFTDQQAAAWVGNLYQESQLSTTAVNPDSGATGLAQWLGGRLTGLRSFAQSRGKPIDALATQLQYIIHELNGPESAAAQAIKSAGSLRAAVDAIAFKYERMGAHEVGDRYGPAQTALERFSDRYATGGYVGKDGSYAMGGELPGGDGKPLSITAHAGEWILNRGHQRRLAEAMGVTTSAIKRLLGFNGMGKDSFREGGEVLHVGDSLGVGVERMLKRLLGATSFSAEGRTSEQALAVLRKQWKKAYDSVIFDVGTNDGHANTLARNLKRAYKLLNDDQQLILSTVRGPAAKAKNAVLREFAERHDNVTLVNTRGVPVGSDGIHMTDKAYGQRARLLARAVKAGGKDDGSTYEQPETAAIGLNAINEQIDLVFKAISKITSKRKEPGKAINKFLKNIKALTDEDGLIDQATEAIELVSERMTTSLDLARAGFRRVRGSLRLRRRRPLVNEARIADREVDIAETQKDAFIDLRQDTRKGLVALNRRLRKYRRDARADGGGISQKERDNIDAMIAARVGFRNKLDEIDANIAAAAQAAREARLNRFNARTERQLRETSRTEGWLGVVGRITGSRGDDAGSLAVGQAQVNNMYAQQDILRGRLAAAQAKAQRNPAFAAVARELEQQIWDLEGSIAEQIRSNFEAGINIINTSFERRNVGNQVWGRIGSAIGNTQLVRQTQANTRALMQQQVEALTAKLPELAAAGQVDLWYQVAGQIGDLQAGIVEITAQIFQGILEDFDKQLTRARAAVDRRSRLNDLRERGGDRLGAVSNRMGLSDERLGLLRAEQRGLEDLRLRAAAQGNVGAVEELTERLADLSVAIEEENATRQDLVYAYRTLSTDIITGQAGRSTGLIGSAQSLIERLGQISGTQTVAQVRALIKQSGEQLRNAAVEIANNVNAGSGEFGAQGGSILNQLAAAFRTSPGSFASKLAELAPAIAALETTMGDTQRAAFQALIQSMLDNTTAVVDNTGQLQQINGVNGQSFSSSLWTTLRMGLFNGSGTPLWNYLPHFATGGIMGWDGPAYLHAGEIVTNPRLGQTAPGGEEHTHVHLHNVEKDVDIGHAFEVVEFKRSQRRAT